MKNILLIIGFTICYVYNIAAQENEETAWSITHPQPTSMYGMYNVAEFITDNLRYPLNEENIQGRVNIDGTIDSISVIRKLHPDFDAAAVRVIQAMPRWIPIRENGRAKSKFYIIPFIFKTKLVEIETKTISTDSILYEPEVMPRFPKGESAMMDFIAKNLRFPVIQQCETEPAQGRVIVRFRVTKTGKIDNISILRGLEERFDREAIRLVKSMPDWTPGKQNGENVDVYFTLPIMFRYN